MATAKNSSATQAQSAHAALTPLPALLGVACEESSVGKTMLMTVIADCLALSGAPYLAFQADDKPRLQEMLGAKVTSLRVDGNRMLKQPSLIRTVYTPIHTACSQIGQNGASVLLDVGAKDVANVASFMEAVGLDEDIASWKVPAVIFVPFTVDPEAVSAAALTWRLFTEAMPSARLVLVENQVGKAISDLSPSGAARRLYDRELAPLVQSAPHLVMPALHEDFWSHFEEAGVRFIKVMAMDAIEGAKRFDMAQGDFKISRGAVTAFFKDVQKQLETIIAFPQGKK